MYFLKKLHKQPHKIRPIVSGCNGPTESVSAFLDSILQPIVPTFASYIRDSTHVVSLLSTLTLPNNTILVTIDVSSLYTTIPQDEGILACSHYISEYNISNIPPQALETLFNT